MATNTNALAVSKTPITRQGDWIYFRSLLFKSQVFFFNYRLMEHTYLPHIFSASKEDIKYEIKKQRRSGGIFSVVTEKLIKMFKDLYARISRNTCNNEQLRQLEECILEEKPTPPPESKQRKMTKPKSIQAKKPKSAVTKKKATTNLTKYKAITPRRARISKEMKPRKNVLQPRQMTRLRRQAQPTKAEESVNAETNIASFESVILVENVVPTIDLTTTNDNDGNKTTSTSNDSLLEFVRQQAEEIFATQCCCVVVDADMLLNNVDFMAKLQKVEEPDAKRVILYLPHCVLSRLRQEHNNPFVKYIADHLHFIDIIEYFENLIESKNETTPMFAQQLFEEPINLSDSEYGTEYGIVNACLQLMHKKCKVVLVTNSDNLHLKSTFYGVETMTKEEFFNRY